ncbi:MAG: Obg family GTPase CgtA [Patescibacteria group bacterium]
MLIDNVKIKVVAGKGGDGAVAFNNVKMALGPTGGSGAKGGDIYIETIADLGALRRFRTTKIFRAENGENGREQFRDGHRGENLVLHVPRGTVVNNITTGEIHELTALDQQVRVAEGGKGGKGNFLYRSPTNTTPKQFQHGKAGDICEIQLELKLIADIGLIGLPNIGKTSFLNEVTNAQNRVANYQFTTLEPNLGAYHELILADIPGLIEGASEGKGLGIKFLKHIERTGILFHFISADSQNPLFDYKTTRKELGAYNPKLLEKQEYIIISKTDTVDKKRITEITKILKPLNKNIHSISIYDLDKMNAIRKLLNAIIEKKTYTL